MARKLPEMKQAHTARMKLLLNNPCFASLLLSMPMEVRGDLWLMATDGRKLFVNPANCEQTPIDQ